MKVVAAKEEEDDQREEKNSWHRHANRGSIQYINLQTVVNSITLQTVLPTKLY
jgi:hypothetical protein